MARTTRSTQVKAAASKAAANAEEVGETSTLPVPATTKPTQAVKTPATGAQPSQPPEEPTPIDGEQPPVDESPASGETPPVTTPEQQWAAKMERLRRRTLAQATLRVYDDQSLKEATEEAERAAERAKLLAEAAPDNKALAERAKAAAAKYAEAHAALEQASVLLTFRALPRPVLEELIAAHPPNDAQAGEGAAFDSDTFPAALISASSTDGMNEAEAAELLGAWSAPDANALWDAAWQIQQESRVDLGKD